MIENPMVSGLNADLDRRAHKESLEERAYIQLRNELIDALMGDPSKIVSTPGFGGFFGSVKFSAAEVVSDSLAGKDGDKALIELLSIVGLAASGDAGPDICLRASAWIVERARVHAEYHAEDLVSNQEGDE